MKFNNIILTSLMCSLFFSVDSMAVEEHSWLVSLQSNFGTHLCNGSYIGNNLVLASRVCREAIIIPLPPIIPVGQGDNGELNLPGFLANQSNASVNSPVENVPIFGPARVVFLVEDTLKSYNITKSYAHPVLAEGMVYQIESVPDNVEPIPLASTEALDNIPPNSSFTMIGKNLSPGSEGISTQGYVSVPQDQCFPSLHKSGDYMCLQRDVEGYFCEITNAAMGAPIIAETADGKIVQVGMKVRDYCEPATNQLVTGALRNWAQSVALKRRGLSVALSYVFPDTLVGKKQIMHIVVDNISSDEIFYLENIHFKSGGIFSVGKNDCRRLAPGERCHIAVSARFDTPKTSVDELIFSSDQALAGIYFSASSTDYFRPDGDRRARWINQGWMEANGNLYVDDKTFSDSIKLIRHSYIVGPATIRIRYRASGTYAYVLHPVVSKREMNPWGGVVSPFEFLNGTEGVWVEAEIPIEEPGSYRFVLNASHGPANKENAYIEIDSICIDSCEY